MQRELVLGLAREAERIADFAPRQRRIGRIGPRCNRTAELVRASMHALDERGIVGPHVRALGRSLGHPPRPVEAVHEVVHVAEPNGPVFAEAILQQRHAMHQRGHVVPGPSELGLRGHEPIEIPQQIARERAQHRADEIDGAARDRIAQRGRIAGMDRGRDELARQARARTPGIEREQLRPRPQLGIDRGQLAHPIPPMRNPITTMDTASTAVPRQIV